MRNAWSPARPERVNEEFTERDILSHASTGYRDDSRQMFVNKPKECCIAAVRPYGPAAEECAATNVGETLRSLAAEQRAKRGHQHENPSHVDTVFIAGKVKKWRGSGSLVGVDRARVMRLAQEARDAVMAGTGFQVELLA